MVRIIPLLLALALHSVCPAYSFSIPSMTCRVEILPDRSLAIEYEALFRCGQSARPIDVIDIGMPGEDWELEDVEASIHGTTIRDIRASEYIENGVELHLGGSIIAPGAQALLELRAVCREMVWKDPSEDGWASVEFSPTWFEGSFLTGSTELLLEMTFPPGATPDRVRYHDVAFTSSRTSADGRIAYAWQTVRRLSGPCLVGVSFPAVLVEGPLRDRPGPGIGEALRSLLPLLFPVLIVGMIATGLTWAVISSRRRARRYLPPSIGVLGSGIRRGLTAPMAALLMEEPLERVMLLIIFGMLKKGVIEHSPEGAIRRGNVAEGLRAYEKRLLPLLTGEEPPARQQVSRVFAEMIEELRKKMIGFSARETREYYGSVIRNAWTMVEKAGEGDRAGEIMADRLQWLLISEDFEERTVGFTGFRGIVPAWVYTRVMGTPGGAPAMSRPVSLSQAASAIVSSLEGSASSIASGLSDIAVSVTGITNPVPSGSTSGGSSGGSCACACACAGCACACAGGGR